MNKTARCTIEQIDKETMDNDQQERNGQKDGNIDID